MNLRGRRRRRRQSVNLRKESGIGGVTGGRLEAETGQSGRTSGAVLGVESLDFERFGGLEESADLLLSDAHLSPVDELENGLQFRQLDVFEDDDGMLLRRAQVQIVVDEERLEVAGAGGQNDPVTLDGSTSARQRHIRQRFRLQQMIESSQQIRTVLIPAEAVLLLRTSTHFSHHF